MIDIKQKSIAGRLGSFFCVSILLPLASISQAKTLIFESGSASVPQTPSVNRSAQNVASAPGASTTITTSQLSSASSANAELFFMIEQLKQEVSELRGLVETQAFQLRNLEVSGKRRYQDLDTRVLAISQQVGGGGSLTKPASATSSPAKLPDAGVVPAVQGEAAKVESSPATPEQRQRYSKAYSLVKSKSFDEAVDSLHSYIELYPEGELTGNAYYWLGEVYLVLPKLEQAKQSFMIVVKTFPDHRKVADSMFKLAVTFDRLLDPVNSEKYLDLVQKRFPNSTASKLAKNYKISR